jgi:crotonobetainyl-CoA:carnitine CoA-transferase CaiB-like acyl-CoA transferase
LSQEPPWRLDVLESASSPVKFSTVSSGGRPQILAGIKVLELCRVIAGPSIGRGLAEYGADVLKITSPNLSDVPFFQVDGNLGKHTADLDLRDLADRKIFEQLLQETDVVLDGYRPGSLERLGYGPKQIVELTKHRGRGIVYVAEDCFGHVGEWARRPGWQQIADCVTGVAWAQGQFMGLDEPVVPPFPMSDYGTGCMGTIAALTGLYKRALYGGSYHGTTSLCQYDLYLLRLEPYNEALLQDLRQMHNPEFFDLRHNDSVDEVGKRALKTVRKNHPELFDDIHFHESFSLGFNAPVKFVKPVGSVEGIWNGFRRCSRPNGFDAPTWKNWETDSDMLLVN